MDKYVDWGSEDNCYFFQIMWNFVKNFKKFANFSLQIVFYVLYYTYTQIKEHSYKNLTFYIRAT